MKKIKYKYDKTHGDKRYFINEDDINVLLSRLPEEVYHRLETVYFKDRSWGNKHLGYVTNGSREIVICAIAPRISFTAFLRKTQKPAMFGAVQGSQWPTSAIRRFMLYDVFLHELGHLQIIDDKAKTIRRKFAGETKAQDFAEYWCKTLWSQHYNHDDPIHNPPSKEELDYINKSWAKSHLEYKKALDLERKGDEVKSFDYYKKGR